MKGNFWAAFGLPTLLFMTQLDLSYAVAGEYITNKILENKRLPHPKKELVASERQTCETFCIRNPDCDAYAISSFQQKCYLYKMQVGVNYVIENGFILYVRRKAKEDGYMIYKDFYVKLMHDLKTYDDAQKECEKEQGNLLAIRNDDLNNFVLKMMEARMMSIAYIGLSDRVEEGKWVYEEGGTASYTPWDWNGHWPRTDKNCALMKINGFWKHTSCLDYNQFICQIPMF